MSVAISPFASSHTLRSLPSSADDGLSVDLVSYAASRGVALERIL
jgi:hypothetical protein